MPTLLCRPPAAVRVVCDAASGGIPPAACRGGAGLVLASDGVGTAAAPADPGRDGARGGASGSRQPNQERDGSATVCSADGSAARTSPPALVLRLAVAGDGR